MSRHHLALADGTELHFTLQLSPRRRSIGLKINAHGLTVLAPRGTSLAMLHQAMEHKQSWITRQLARWQEQHATPVWQDGMDLQFLGQRITLTLRHGSSPVHFDGFTLTLTVPGEADAAHIRHKVMHWYKQRARADFKRRISLFAAKLGLPPPPLSLSSARTRWGSCNNQGNIRLNWQLIQASPQIINYVVAHEIAHLKEMNHSEQFWQWVAVLYPDYQTAKMALKQQQIALQSVFEERRAGSW